MKDRELLALALEALQGELKECCFFLLDKYGQVAYWNRAAERVVGYQASELIGRPLSAVLPQEISDAGLTTAGATGRYEHGGWQF